MISRGVGRSYRTRTDRCVAESIEAGLIAKQFSSSFRASPIGGGYGPGREKLFNEAARRLVNL